MVIKNRKNHYAEKKNFGAWCSAQKKSSGMHVAAKKIFFIQHGKIFFFFFSCVVLCTKKISNMHVEAKIFFFHTTRQNFFFFFSCVVLCTKKNK